MEIYKLDTKDKLCEKCFREEKAKKIATIRIITWWTHYDFCEKHAFDFVDTDLEDK